LAARSYLMKWVYVKHSLPRACGFSGAITVSCSDAQLSPCKKHTEGRVFVHNYQNSDREAGFLDFYMGGNTLPRKAAFKKHFSKTFSTGAFFMEKIDYPIGCFFE